jgi:hypothetical protein
MQMYRAKAERKCIKGHVIAAGEAYYGYRERATCSYEALHGGRYPKRILCKACGEARLAHFAKCDAEKQLNR